MRRYSCLDWSEVTGYTDSGATEQQGREGVMADDRRKRVDVARVIVSA